MAAFIDKAPEGIREYFGITSDFPNGIEKFNFEKESIEYWKRRAINAEAKVEKLKSTIETLRQVIEEE